MLKALSGFASFLASFASPPPIGSTTPNTGAFTTLTATSETVGTAAVAVTIAGGTTGQPASAIASGTDTNIVGVGIGPKGTGAFQLQATDSGTAGGNARGTNAFDGQTTRGAATQVAAGVSSVALGASNTAGGTNSFVVGGGSSATGTRGGALGYQADDRARYGTLVHSNGQRAAGGDSQTILNCNLRGTTTDAATGVRLTANAGAAGSTNVVNPANTTALRFRILLVAMVANTSAKEWTIDGLVRRGANAASTAFPTAAVIVSAFGDAGLATCAVACTADTTNGGINITVNGVVATTIQWVATVRGVEVG